MRTSELKVEQVPKKALRVKEAQFALGLGKTKIYDLIKQGILPSILIGGVRLIPIEAIDELLSGARTNKS